jgi:hypothetical protein
MEWAYSLDGGNRRHLLNVRNIMERTEDGTVVDF